MKNLPVDFESSQHAIEPGRLSSQLIYFRISLKTVIFAIIKISPNENYFYGYKLALSMFRTAISSSGHETLDIPCFLTASLALICCIQTAELNWTCRNFRFSRKAKAQFRAYKHYQGAKYYSQRPD